MVPPRVLTFPSRARSKFGGGRIGEVRPAADVTEGNFAACLLDAEIPASLRKGALEPL